MTSSGSIAGRSPTTTATALTSITPVGPLGKITQLAYGALAPRNITTNIAVNEQGEYKGSLQTGVSVPFSPEFRELATNEALLRRMVETEHLLDDRDDSPARLDIRGGMASLAAGKGSDRGEGDRQQSSSCGHSPFPDALSLATASGGLHLGNAGGIYATADG